MTRWVVALYAGSALVLLAVFVQTWREAKQDERDEQQDPQAKRKRTLKKLDS